MARLFAQHRFRQVVHLAAQAGVRYSLVDPHAYVDANLSASSTCWKAAATTAAAPALRLVVVGLWREQRAAVLASSTMSIIRSAFTAPTKKANELMAHAYAHLFGLPTTGLRFFTVYGPWGRPDMAYWLFTEAILAGRPIKLFNHGRMRRDFTYVDDVVEAVVRLIDRPPVPAGQAANPARAPGGSTTSATTRRSSCRTGHADRAGARPHGYARTHADAARRRARDLRRCRRPDARCRLSPGDAAADRHRAVHRLVPGLSPRLTRAFPRCNALKSNRDRRRGSPAAADHARDRRGP